MGSLRPVRGLGNGGNSGRNGSGGGEGNGVVFMAVVWTPFCITQGNLLILLDVIQPTAKVQSYEANIGDSPNPGRRGKARPEGRQEAGFFPKRLDQDSHQRQTSYGQTNERS